MAKIKVATHGSKKDAILKKAASLFRKKGFASSSMRELAESIGVEAPSLYNHIGSKSELLQDICFKVANDFTLQLREVESSAAGNTGKIEQLIRFHVRMMLQSFDEVYVSNHEWKHLKEPHLSNFLAQRKLYEGKLVQLIREGITEKELKNLHPHVAALTILSAVRGLEFWQRHKKDISTDVLENNMVQHLLNGLTI
ncbi:MAG: transcriptional regulator, TetR family [Ferruginibacter sp.]|nr:transcriptional regulator, TetR family [Ferruginibacter sp.]